MSAISDEIKKSVDIIFGQQRLTIMQLFIKEKYKKDLDKPLKNLGAGEYSPNGVMEHLRLIINHLKSLCAEDGKLMSRYYSLARSEEILNGLRPLVNNFNNLKAESAGTVKRRIFFDIPPVLESMKNILGPFTDLKLADEMQSLSKEINKHQDKLASIDTSVQNVEAVERKISDLYEKSAKNVSELKDFEKEIADLKDSLKSQEDASEEVYERARTISKSIEKQQTDLEKRYENVRAVDNELQEIKHKCSEGYNVILAKTQEFDSTQHSMSEAQARLNALISQARHVLNFSNGLGLLQTYRSLYKHASRKIFLAPWLIGTIIGFISSAFLLAFSYIAVRSAVSFTLFFHEPYTVFQVILTPFMIFVFFFCLAGWRKQCRLIEKYRLRSVGVESYLRISEKLPLESPEYTRAASTLMRHIEQDFSPASNAVFQNGGAIYQDVI